MGSVVTEESSSASEDFTVVRYRELVQLALRKYPQASYGAIPWSERFVLWRHDVDISLNRALVLARLEAAEGLEATYFVNLHSGFYNLLESGQASRLREILELGHDLGLHFDAGYYGNLTESELEKVLAQEALWLEQAFGRRPLAFSFHNPLAEHLKFESESYAGLINCYSSRFKTAVAYCSDSNGYWRFHSLQEVLLAANVPRLQVLTHPGWWQDKYMVPRQRIFRSAWGRAQATIDQYDSVMHGHHRLNHAGFTDRLRFLQPINPRAFALYDYLWNQGHLAALFLELWRLHERQINQFCKAVFRKEWQVPATEVNAFFEDRSLAIDGWRLFKAVFGSTWPQAAGLDEGQYKDWVALRNSLIHGRSTAPGGQLEEGCVFLCRAIEALVAWGRSQPMAYDGISHLGSIGIPTYKTADGSLTDRLEEIADDVPGFPGRRWERFKAEMQKVGAGEAAE